MTAPGAPVAPDDTERGLYAVSPAAVASLASDVRIVEPGGTQNTGRAPITNDRIIYWIDAVSARVAVRLSKLPQITDQVKLDLVAEFAKAIVADGAASYLEDAAHPGREGLDNTTHAAVLWKRFLDGLNDLVATIDGWIDDGTAGGGTVTGGAAWSFPCPTVLDRNPWVPSW